MSCFKLVAHVTTVLPLQVNEIAFSREIEEGQILAYHPTTRNSDGLLTTRKMEKKSCENSKDNSDKHNSVR